MSLSITAESRKIWQETLARLEGQARRLFMASVVNDLGRGGAAWAQRELGWDRKRWARDGMGWPAVSSLCGQPPVARAQPIGSASASLNVPAIILRVEVIPN